MSAPAYPEDDDRQSDLAVMESNEYKQKRRLRAILDAHDEVEEIDREGYRLLVEGEISQDGYNLLWLRAVKRLIRECYPLIQEYWAGLESEHDDPEAHDEYLTTPKLGEIKRAHEDDVIFEGLADIRHADQSYTETWTETQSSRHGTDESVTRRTSHTVPKDVSEEAFLLVKKFLSDEHDLRVTFEEMDDSRPFHDLREDYEYEP